MSCLVRFIMFTKHFCKKRCWNKLIGQDSLISLLHISYFVLDFVHLLYVFQLALICMFQPAFFSLQIDFFSQFSLLLISNLHQLQLMRFQLSFFLDHVLMPGWSFSKQECVSVFSFSFHKLKRWYSFFLGCRCLIGAIAY